MSYQQIQKQIQLFSEKINGLRRETGPEVKNIPRNVQLALLYTLQIRAYTDMIRRGYRTGTPEAVHAFRESATAIEKFFHSQGLMGDAISAAAELAFLLDSGTLPILMNQLPPVLREKIRRKGLLSEAYCSLFRYVIICCHRNGMHQLGCSIAEGLVVLSAERNARKLSVHRHLVQTVLAVVYELDQSCACRIGDGQEGFFSKARGEDACIFYWIYALSLSHAGRYDDAIAMFQCCYAIGRKLTGEACWIGTKARILGGTMQLELENDQSIQDQLWEILAEIKEGRYSDVEENTMPFAAAALFALMKTKLDSGDARGYLVHLEWLLDYCSAHEEENRDLIPVLTRRNVETLLAVYHEQEGAYLSAAKHTINALKNNTNVGNGALVSDDTIITNLMAISAQLNDIDAAERLDSLLGDRLAQYDPDDPALSGMYYRIHLARFSVRQKFGAFSDEDVQSFRESLNQVYDALEAQEADFGDDVHERSSAYMLIICMILSVLDGNAGERPELVHYRYIARYFYSQPDDYPLTPRQKLLVYITMAYIEYQLQSLLTTHFLKLAARQCSLVGPENDHYIPAMRFITLCSLRIGELQTAYSGARCMLNAITRSWKKAVTYLNDHKVSKLLMFCTVESNLGYAVLRSTSSPKQLYTYVLQYKDLPSLVCRERNRIVHNGSIDEQLRDRIFSLQDQLASAEHRDTLLSTDTTSEYASELLRLEAEFAERFPQNVRFTEIYFDAMAEKLPDNSAVVEYYFSVDVNVVHNSEKSEQDSGTLDIFVTVKRNGRISLECIKLGCGDQIEGLAREYVELLQSPEESDAVQKVTLCAELYRRLIGPVRPYLDGITVLYIAPDQELCNLPFEILRTGDSKMLQEQYMISRLVCGRDLLYDCAQVPLADGVFVLGDPDYEFGGSQPTQEAEYSRSKKLQPVRPLPFSQIEAARIAKRYHARCTTGKDATKYAVISSATNGIIHLATHGCFDQDDPKGALYASYLVFAGYNGWLFRKEENSSCGNGILTADEISRINLRQTGLVVLSACCSGLEDITCGTAQGLVSSFAATGVRWVISHLWEADDFATAILMDAFYDALQAKGMSVPEALQYARTYLRCATIGQLRTAGWFDAAQEQNLPEEAASLLRQYARSNDRRIPFADECYWGGFICHKCN